MRRLSCLCLLLAVACGGPIDVNGAATGALEGACYEDGSCNEGLVCSAKICRKPEVKQPVAVLDPTTLTFDAVALGHSASLSVQLRNGATAVDALVLSLVAADVIGEGFSLVSVPEGTIAPGASGSIWISFAPTKIGAHAGTLTLQTNDPARPSIDVALAGTGRACNAQAGECDGCSASSECSAPFNACDPSSRLCVVCAGDADCVRVGAGKRCLDKQECVECTTNTDCGSGAACNIATNTCVECNVDADCASNTARPLCDATTSKCVQCKGDANCSGNTPACSDARQCVQCTEDADCASRAGTTRCNRTANACVECTSGSQCPSGTCTANRCTTPNPTLGDSCSAPIQIDLSSGSTTITGTLVGATHEAVGSCSEAGPDLVYRFTLATPKNVTATITGVTGTSVSITSPCGGGGSAGLCSNTGTLSAQNLTAGTWFLRVDSASTTPSGTFTLTVTATTPTPQPPANDQCSAPQTIDLSSGTAVVNGTLAAATNENVSICNGSGPDVVYRFTLPVKSDVRAEVSGVTNPAISITSGCGTGTNAVCVSGQPIATARNLAAGTWYLRVDTNVGSGGPFTLTVTASSVSTDPPPNDGFCSPLALDVSSGSATVGGSLAYATNDGQVISCSGTGPDVIYSVTTTSPKTITARVTGLTNPVVSIGSGCAGGTEPGCSSGGDTATAVNVGAGTWFIRVDTNSATAGSFTLNVTVATPTWTAPPNDTCASPTTLQFNAAGVATVSGTTLGARNDDVLNCGDIPASAGGDVVYTFTTPALGALQASVTAKETSPNFRPVLKLRRAACAESAGSNLACDYPNDDGVSYINAMSLPAGTYFLIVDGAAGPGETQPDIDGAFDLTVRAGGVVPAPVVCQSAMLEVQTPDWYTTSMQVSILGPNGQTVLTKNTNDLQRDENYLFRLQLADGQHTLVLKDLDGTTGWGDGWARLWGVSEEYRGAPGPDQTVTRTFRPVCRSTSLPAIPTPPAGSCSQKAQLFIHTNETTNGRTKERLSLDVYNAHGVNVLSVPVGTFAEDQDFTFEFPIEDGYHTIVQRDAAPDGYTLGYGYMRVYYGGNELFRDNVGTQAWNAQSFFAACPAPANSLPACDDVTVTLKTGPMADDVGFRVFDPYGAKVLDVPGRSLADNTTYTYPLHTVKGRYRMEFYDENYGQWHGGLVTITDSRGSTLYRGQGAGLVSNDSFSPACFTGTAGRATVNLISSFYTERTSYNLYDPSGRRIRHVSPLGTLPAWDYYQSIPLDAGTYIVEQLDPTAAGWNGFRDRNNAVVYSRLRVLNEAGGVRYETASWMSGDYDWRPSTFAVEQPAVANANAPTRFGDLVITEVMADPQIASDATGEWFELWNATNTTWNLRGCQVLSDDTESHTIASDLLVAPGDYVVLAKSAPAGFTPDYVFTGLNLANSGGDSLSLRCGAVAIDRMVWNSATAGRSRSLDPDSMTATANDPFEAWCTSPAVAGQDNGTPGAANAQCP